MRRFISTLSAASSLALVIGLCASPRVAFAQPAEKRAAPPPAAPSGAPAAAPAAPLGPAPAAPAAGQPASADPQAPVSAARPAPSAGMAPYPYPYPYPYQPPYMAGPETLPYREGAPIPAGYHVDTGSNKTVIVAGLSVFGAAYAISLVVGLTVLSFGGSHSDEFAPLLIPVVGPFVTMGTADDVTATMALDGITQVTGAVITAIGVGMTERKLVRNDLGIAVTPLLRPEIGAGPRGVSLKWQF